MGSSACSFRSRGAFNVVRGSRRPVKDAVAMFLSTCHVRICRFPQRRLAARDYSASFRTSRLSLSPRAPSNG